jgi:N4-gp56 family major capsid protein
MSFAGMNNVNTTTDNASFPNASAAVYYDKRLLTRLEKELHFDQFGQKKTLPKGSGRTITFTRYTNFVANTSPLTEAQTPTGLELASTQIPCIPLQYGDFVTLSDYLIGESIDPVIEGALDVLQYRAALSIDTIIRNTLDGNVTKQFANKVANEASVAGVMLASEIRRAVYALRNVAARRIGNSYPTIISPAQSFDLQSENATGSWLDLNKYTTTGPTYKGEIGSIYGARIVESPNVYVHTGAGSGSVDVHQAYMFSQEAYGLVELAGNNLKTIIKQLGSAGSADPLDQRSTVGYKFSHVTKVLDVLRAIEIYTATAAY